MRVQRGRSNGDVGQELVGVQKLNVELLNVQGLTAVKAVELQEVVGEETELVLLCLTETQQKYKKVDFREDIQCVEKMREMDDKKGGGLTALMRKRQAFTMRQLNCEDPDVMRVEVSLQSVVLNIMVVYVDGKLKNKAENTYKCLDREMQTLRENETMVILGDFNGHVGFLGKQDLDAGGKRLLNFMET